MKNFFLKLWHDPVSINLIGSLIFGFGDYLIATILSSKASIQKSPENTNYEKIVLFFQTEFGKYLGVFLLLVFLVLLIIYIIKLIKGYRLKRRFNKYTSDTFWNANYKWKWTKYGKKFKILFNDIQMICPNCQNDLAFANYNGLYFYLTCTNCVFNSQPFATATNYPAQLALNFPAQDIYITVFMIEFNSNINGELRILFKNFN